MLFNVSQNELIEKTAEELKKLIHMPSWGPFVKTGVHKQRPPIDPDWWYIRAAAVLRKVYLLGPIGVSKLRTKYGGKKNRGVKPGRFCKGSGNILRKVLQQLEEAKLIKQTVVGKHKGRVITPKGASLLFSVAKSMGGKIPKKVPKPQPVKEVENKVEEKKEEKPKKEEKKKSVATQSEDSGSRAKPVVPKEEQLLKAPPAKKIEKKKEKTEEPAPVVPKEEPNKEVKVEEPEEKAEEAKK
ncbi:MAG: 30S ribosomal protein S19e [archaeon]